MKDSVSNLGWGAELYSSTPTDAKVERLFTRGDFASYGSFGDRDFGEVALARQRFARSSVARFSVLNTLYQASIKHQVTADAVIKRSLAGI